MCSEEQVLAKGRIVQNLISGTKAKVVSLNEEMETILVRIKMPKPKKDVYTKWHRMNVVLVQS